MRAVHFGLEPPPLQSQSGEDGQTGHMHREKRFDLRFKEISRRFDSRGQYGRVPSWACLERSYEKFPEAS